MKKSHYKALFLLLGSLLSSPLDATEQKSQENDDEKHQAASYSDEQEDYTHGDFSFMLKVKDKVDPVQLKEGLIHLSERLKAKDGQKVYFFLGGIGVGKSISILALQGNKVQKVASNIFDSDDLALAWEKFNNPKNAHRKGLFDVKYVLPKPQVPLVGHKTQTTTLYYLPPKQPGHQKIAFVDTEGFSGARKATSTEKCLAAASFLYTLRGNSVGGFVFVLSATALDASRGKSLKLLANLLQKYLQKGVDYKTISPSILIMITKVDGLKSYFAALGNIRKEIQAAYQAYYASTANSQKFKNLYEKYIKIGERCKALQQQKKALLDKDQQIDKERKNLDKAYDKLYPRKKQLDSQQADLYEKRTALDKKCTNLDKASKRLTAQFKDLAAQCRSMNDAEKEIHTNTIFQKRKKLLATSSTLLEIDKNLYQQRLNIGKKITAIGNEYKNVYKECEKISQKKENLDQEQKNLYEPTKSLYEAYATLSRKSTYLKEEIKHLLEADQNMHPQDKSAQEENHRVKLFCEMLLEKEVPLNQIDDIRNFKLDKKRFCFILPWEEKCIEEIHNRLQQLKPIAPNLLSTLDNPVSQYIEASLLDFSRELTEAIQPLLTLKRKIAHIQKHSAGLKNKQEAAQQYDALTKERNRLIKAWDAARNRQVQRWEGTANMLMFFADHILAEPTHQKLIKGQLKDFREAAQLKNFQTGPSPKGHIPSLGEAQVPSSHFPHRAADQQQLNHLSVNNEVFDID